MKNHALKRTALPGLVAVLSLVQAHAVNPGYLKSVGPPPLRFQVIKVHPMPLPPLPPAIAPESQPTPEPPVSDPKPASNPNSSSSINSLLPGPPVESILNENISSLLPKPAEPDGEKKADTAAANELLVISPQMLIEYFKSTPGSTNGAGVSAFVPVQFTPATPAAAPSSKAIYRTE